MAQPLSGLSAGNEDLSDQHSTDRSARRGKSRDRQFDAYNLAWGELRDWLQLVRLPNVFTLLSDCVAAAVVAVGLAWL